MAKLSRIEQLPLFRSMCSTKMESKKTKTEQNKNKTQRNAGDEGASTETGEGVGRLMIKGCPE